MNNLPLLSYVVITHDRKSELARCLANLSEQTWPNKEVIVVDNGSTDGTADMVRQQHPEAHLLVLPNNLGVAAGRNQGIRKARGDICVFLDDDAEFTDPHAGNIIVALFEHDPLLAVVAFTIRNAATKLEEHSAIPRIDKRRIASDYVCTYFCGCGFAARRAAFEKVGFFWEFLIYAGEELDLSYRLSASGYRLLHTRSVEVLHHSAPAGRPPGQYIYFNVRNRVLIALRNLPWPYVVTTALLWWTRLGYLGICTGQVRFWLVGMRDAFRAAIRVIRERQCIGSNTVRVLRMHSGRCWY